MDGKELTEGIDFFIHMKDTVQLFPLPEEPVGGMKWAEVKSIQEVMNLDSFINAIRHNSPPNDTIKLLQEHFWAAVDAIQKAITPPIKTEGEDEIVIIERIYDAFANWYHDDGSYDTFLRSEAMKLIKEYASAPPSPDVDELADTSFFKINADPYYNNRLNKPDFIVGFKAGYSASLPSSSVTGEEDKDKLWKELNELIDKLPKEANWFGNVDKIKSVIKKLQNG